MSKRTKHYLIFALVLAGILTWTGLMLYLGPRTIVDAIGVQNGYLLMFLVSLFGGVSSIGGAIYVTTIITLASAGLNPLYLALASGSGVSIGDSVYYYLGYRGSHILPKENPFTKRIHQFSDWLTARARWVRVAGIYSYTAFTPFPNDVLTILMGIARQPYLLVIPAFVVGNITHTFLLATLGQQLPW